MERTSSDKLALLGNCGFDKSIENPSCLNVSTCLSTIGFTGAKTLLVRLVNAFFSALPLSVAATFFPLKANKVRTTFDRSTLCKSATASMFNFRKSENKRSKPKKPLCRSFKSTPKKFTFGIPSKKG